MALGLTFAIAAFTTVFKMSTVYDVVYLNYFLLISVILGEGVVRKQGVLKLSGAAIITPWLILTIGFVVLQSGFGLNLDTDIRLYLRETADQVFKMQDAVASLSAPQIAYIRENTVSIVDFMLWTAPSAVFLFGMIVVSLTVLLARVFTKKYGSLKYFGNVAVQKFPFWPVWITIFCGAAFFINNYFVNNVYLKFAAINGLICCAGVFFIQGCFVVSFWLHKGKSPILKLLVYGIIIAFLQVVGIIIIALGLSDQWVDFRRRSVNHTTTTA